jgi:hypothetical protein
MLATVGGIGIWYLYDLILVASGDFRDVEGRRVALWDPQDASAGGVPEEVLEELHALRAEVAELSERVDFAERLLAQPRPESPSHRSAFPS